jgi:hypothetical protein
MAGLLAFLNLAIAEQERLEALIFDGEDEAMWFVESIANSVRALTAQS